MKNVRNLEKHLLTIKRFGFWTELITLYNRKIKNDYTDFYLSKKREKFFINLDVKEYPKYLSEWYKIKTGHDLNLDNPVRFTEKIQWLKLYGMGDIETQLADKWLVRNWVEYKIGAKHLFEVFGAWNSYEEIPFETFPRTFMLKGNHGSQMNFLVDKENVNYSALEKKVNQWLLINHAHANGCFEMQYLNIPRKIIAERYMTNNDNEELNDYKFHCFNGKPMFCEVICDRTSNETIDYFDMEWKHQDFIDEAEYSKIKNSAKEIEKPDSFEEMKRIANILCEGFTYVRVDLYDIDGMVYFGEMTFTPASGGDIFTPDDADFMLGEMLNLPSEKKAIIEKQR